MALARRARPRQALREENEELETAYGAPRLHAELRFAEGVRVGKKRVARLMREQGIQGVSRRRGRVRTTTPDPKEPPSPDLVRRDFSAERPDQI